MPSCANRALVACLRNGIVSASTKDTCEDRAPSRQAAAQTQSSRESAWRRETYTLQRSEARDKARDYFLKFPKAAYMTEIESWRELPDDCIEFTIRRLPSAD